MKKIKSILLIVAVLGFVCIVVALHIVQTDYSLSDQLMSELALGELGSYMFFAFLSFAIALYTAQQILAEYQSIIIIRLLLITASFSLAGAGFFTLADNIVLHVTLVFVAFILIVLSMYLIPRQILQFQHRMPTVMCWGLSIATAASVALGQSLLPIGIAQRLATSCILIWLLWLAVYYQYPSNKYNNK